MLRLVFNQKTPIIAHHFLNEEQAMKLNLKPIVRAAVSLLLLVAAAIVFLTTALIAVYTTIALIALFLGYSVYKKITRRWFSRQESSEKTHRIIEHED